MSKEEFLAQLRGALAGLPQDDIEERLAFYSEIIEDRMEEGLSESEAVAAVGSIEAIVAQIVAETSLIKIAKERIKPKRRLKAGEIVLLALGSPIWLSLGIAAFAVVLSLYAVLWSFIVSLWAIFASVAACFVGGVLACIVFAAAGNGASGMALLAAGIASAGLAIFMLFGCKAATKGILILTKKMAIWMKNCCIGKERAQ